MDSVVHFWKQITWKNFWLPLLVIILFKICFLVGASMSFGSLPFSIDNFYGNYQYRTITPEAPSFISESATLPFMLSHFDGQWYIQIAEQGYNPKALFEEPRNIVFYPLYPALLAGFNFIIQNTALASLLLANIFSALGLLLFWKLSRFEFGTHKEAYWALGFIVLLPMGVFWHASYTEGLFLLLSIASIFSARKKNWIGAGLFGALATLTKVQGVLLFPILLLEWWLQYRESKKEGASKLSWLWILAIPLALICFFAYMYTLTGDFWASIEAQKSFGGGRVLGFRPDVLWETFTHLAPVHTYRASPIDAAFVGAWLLLLLVGFKSIRPTYWLLSAFALVLPLSSWSIMSMGRYSLVAFPLVWIILYLTKRWWYVRVPLLIVSGLAMCYFTQMFIHHYWVG